MSRPESTPNPADAWCNSQLAQYSNTPSLRVAGFEDEDDDEDENEAPCEWRTKGLFWAWCVDSVSRANMAILDCTNTLAPAQRLGRHFQGDFIRRLTQG
jgi:hypothetical protein